MCPVYQNAWRSRSQSQTGHFLNSLLEFRHVKRRTTMRMITTLGVIALVSLANAAFAQSAPSLPASAKKLSGKEITALYDGLTINFNNFTMKQPLIGTDTYNLKGHSHQGTYSMGGKSGTFSGRARVKGDQFCHKEGSGAEHCAFVYTDGADIYETNAKGIVESLNHKQ
jgi:hypothetical protein